METENIKTKIFKKGNIAYIIIVLGIFTLFPFIYISQYNHPSADDFGLAVRQADLLQSVVKTYNNWSGRYFATIMSKINPLRYDSFRMFKISPIILICLFGIAISSFIHHLFRRYYTLKHIFAISFLLIFLFFLQMPSTSEGFFWFSGYITYLVPSILTIFLMVALISTTSIKSNFPKLVLTIISSILCIVIIGSNEISLLLVNMIILFLNINYKLIGKGYNKVLLFLLLICVISTIIEIIAPGNFIRLAKQEYGNNLKWALLGSLFLTLTSIIKWSIPVIIISIFYSIYWGIPLAKKITSEGITIDIDFRLSIIFYIAFVYLSIFTHVWVTGYNPAGRVSNVIYLFFIIGWFINLQLFLNKQIKVLKNQQAKISNFLLICSILLVLLLPFNLSYNISTAYIDLISGKAKSYNNELNFRYQLIMSCDADSCVVPALSEIPKSIFFSDIKEEHQEKNNNNVWYSRYFEKSYIYLDSENPDIKSNQETLKDFGKMKRKEWFDSQKN